MAYGDYRGPNKPNKGQENGACNRTACQCEPALWYNHGSMSWYCEECKIDIDRANPGADIVLGKPMFETRAMMDARERGTASSETARRRDAVEKVLKAGGLKMTTIPTPEEQLSMDDPKVQTRMFEVVSHYGKDRFDLLNDFTMGNIVRMLDRDDLMHEAIVMSSRNRIWKLSLDLQNANARIAELEAQVAGSQP